MASPTPVTDHGARPMLRVGAVELDLQAPTVRIHRGSEVTVLDLPITEHRLLAFLLQTPGHARSRQDICAGVWQTAPVDLRTVDQYVRRLRLSLHRAGASAIVQTLNRYGYRVEPALLPGAPKPLTPGGTVTALSHAVSTVPSSPTTSSIDRS